MHAPSPCWPANWCPSPCARISWWWARADARRRAHHAGRALGRVTHAVLQHAHCPVAVVPRG
ncbi:universal stress protein [Streptomyces hirsutus]|uniref:universal stress protein n=1 Tax=Streptomyces hirsutus TaxID=35620 RepID=UPI003D15FA57